jgi:hypothetical protein
MKVKILRDIIGQPYLGIDVHSSSMDAHGENMKTLLDKFRQEIDPDSTMRDRLLNRNNGVYHLTLFNVPEYNHMRQDSGDIIGTEITDLEFLGLGSVKNDEVWFVVVKSHQLDRLRSSRGFESKDFHITIGFKDKDYFKEPKGEDSIKYHLTGAFGRSRKA